MELTRSAGVLLPVASLPGGYGLGDLGQEAYRFIDWLADAGQSWWQFLPLGMPGSDNNPYKAQSSWAGAEYYLDFDQLVEAGDLTPSDVREYRERSSNRVNYRRVVGGRRKLLPLAAERFFGRSGVDGTKAYQKFCKQEKSWLEDWVCYAALRRNFRFRPYWEWPVALRLGRDNAVKQFKSENQDLLLLERYIQFRFFEQWDRMRRYARRQGIRLIGDVPVYCASDSADVWAAPKMFKLRKNGRPAFVAGVPPDYFSKTGQLWGTPVYDWRYHKRTKFKWWISRLRGALATADIVRIDHFRGIEAYWEIPGSARTAKPGRWVKGPGDEFFRAVRRALGDAPFIAEDLGEITDKVLKIRDRWGMPGMRVLQFAFSGKADNPHRGFNHVPHSVVYTGTHDNNTTLGWYKSATAAERRVFERYTGSSGKEPHLDLVRTCLGSVADLAIVPVQDIVGLDGNARLNRPGIDAGNYLWKLKPGDLSAKHAKAMLELVEIFGR